MQRAPIIPLLVLFLLAVCSSVQAANVVPYITSSDAFYQSEPDQLPLSEQMSAVINSPPDPIQTAQTSPIRIAILFSNSAQALANKAMLYTFEKRMQELGIAYQVLTYDRLLQGGLRDPLAVIKRDKPDYVIATHLDRVQSRVVENILNHHLAQVIYFNLSTPLMNWKYHPPLMYVGFDQAKVVGTLASYIDRQLPKNTPIAALTLHSSYLNDVRCNRFLDAMAGSGRPVETIQAVADNKNAAFDAAEHILKKTPNAFIFSCTQAISDGVVSAIKQQHKASMPSSDNQPSPLEPSGLHQAQTNSWGVSEHEVRNLTHHYVLVSSLFMWDDLVIAVAEGIKGNMEGLTEPSLYVGRTTIMSAEQGATSLRLMIDQAYRYSKGLR